jgi:hypothetical protein
MTPREFLEAVVRFDVAEFRDEYGDIRRAYHAVTAADALAAHIFVWCRTNAPAEITGLDDDNHYRGKLSERSSEFRLLRDIAKAQKHVHLERGKPEVTEAAQVVARTFGWGEGDLVKAVSDSIAKPKWWRSLFEMFRKERKDERVTR